VRFFKRYKRPSYLYNSRMIPRDHLTHRRRLSGESLHQIVAQSDEFENAEVDVETQGPQEAGHHVTSESGIPG
jgi:hypothetical protein